MDGEGSRLLHPVVGNLAEIGAGVVDDDHLRLAEGRQAEADLEWEAIRQGAHLARGLGLEVHAGHGLNYETAETISALPEIVELNIGHFLVGEAVFVGLSESVGRMRAAMDKGRRALRARAPEGVPLS